MNKKHLIFLGISILGIFVVCAAESNLLASVTVLGSEGNLRAYYAFEGDALDLSNNGNNGILNGNPVFTSGKIGKAINFDGKDDYVIGVNGINSGILDTHSENTVISWINWGGSSDKDCIFREGGVISGYQLWIKGGSKEIFYTIREGGARDSVKCSVKLFRQGWNHVTAVFDGNNKKLKLYINGEMCKKKDTFASQIADPVRGWSTGGNPSGVREIFENSPNCWFKGKIDEVKILNRALTNEEIFNEYSSY